MVIGLLRNLLQIDLGGLLQCGFSGRHLELQASSICTERCTGYILARVARI